MITNVKVNGFRSLIDFSLDLFPGLNILVGPNGSGKTNIITFFEFLSHLVSCGPSEAINRLGGAGSTFTKIGEEEFQKHIDVEIQGCAQYQENKCVQYNYNFIIEASSDFDLIRFSQQELKLQNCSAFTFDNSNLNTAFTVNQTSSDGCKDYKFKLTNYTKKMVDSSFLPASMRKKFVEDQNMMEEFLKSNVSEDMPLLASLSFFIESTRVVLTDLRGGQVFNIIPSRVKTPEESSGTVGIQKDGSGLAATLYAIKNRKKQRQDIVFPGRFILRRGSPDADIRETTLADIIKYLATANEAIKNIDVENDRFDNLLKVRFWIEKEDHSTVLPLSAMSDGTIKWLSLVTAILTTPSIFSLEEPENFLHPLMQSEVVKLMRSAAETKQKRLSVLMSTHSETILNSASPAEIVIVDFDNGRTRASRCTNQEEIREEIRKTGFGLGFYYISGGMTNE